MIQLKMKSLSELDGKIESARKQFAVEIITAKKIEIITVKQKEYKYIVNIVQVKNNNDSYKLLNGK